MARLPTTFCAVVTERRLLWMLAYRLLASPSAAEQAVRETYTRWYTLPAAAQDRVDNPLSWLVGTLVRVCVVGRPRPGICVGVGARRYRAQR
ncbi:sigma factor [Asanoa sp. NPDC050611]|uniref:sigma factor n=1 Tax=Asanoa sp. NPDC050611 TaxID=3157098 RepID=UPI0033D42973